MTNIAAGDMVECPSRFFDDNNKHCGKVTEVSPDKSRLVIVSNIYPFNFRMSAVYVTKIREEAK